MKTKNLHLQITMPDDADVNISGKFVDDLITDIAKRLGLWDRLGEPGGSEYGVDIIDSDIDWED